MDSCHLFNFLFGTKRATTELSKCFSSMAGSSTNSKTLSSKRKQHKGTTDNSSSCQSNSNHNNSTNNNDRDNNETDDDITPPYESNGQTNKPPTVPRSPLKQLQMRLANSLTPNKQAAKSRPQSGTYRAALVRLGEDETYAVEDNTGAAEMILDNEAREPVGHNQKDSSLAACLPDRVELAPNKADYNANEVSLDTKELNVNEPQWLETAATNQEPQERRPGTRGPMAVAKRVVLYDNPNEGHCESEQRSLSIVSSAEVYNIVNEFGEARARLRRIGSVTYGNTNDNHDDQMAVNCRSHSHDSNSNSSNKSMYDNQHQPSGTNGKVCGHVEDNSRVDKRSAFVKSLVHSIESNGSFDSNSSHQSAGTQGQTEEPAGGRSGANKVTNQSSKPVTIVKPMPPKTPPKTNKAKYINWQMGLNKPIKVAQLFEDESFLTRFFDKLEPLDRCNAAQVCRKWRNILYAQQDYWKDIVNVIDCTQLRRDQLVECIMNTLQTAKLKQQAASQISQTTKDDTKSQLNHTSIIKPLGRVAKHEVNNNNNDNIGMYSQYEQISNELDQQLDNFKSKPVAPSIDPLVDIDQADVWRIQELCNRFTQRTNQVLQQQRHQQQQSDQMPTQQTTGCAPSKSSSSIPSQMSSTLSSVSLSSLLSPWSESSRIDCIKEKLYASINDRGFDAICLFGATDEDIEDLVNKMPAAAHKRIAIARLNNCCMSNRGLYLFVSTFNQVKEIELSGCNEITNSFELKGLPNLRRLVITDCINIADGIAQRLAQILPQLDELTLQAYHLTDAFLEYLATNTNSNRLKRLELPNCKEITNQSVSTLAKLFDQLEYLSISGSTKISDDGIEILAEQAHRLKSLDLSWCSRITDASLECIACDLGETLTDLILDRNVYITDMGLSHLATMSKLTSLYLRWCPRVTDVGLESILVCKSLKYLSLAGLHQITARSLLCLVETDLLEIELTNCPAVNRDLLMFLSSKLPKCNIIF